MKTNTILFLSMILLAHNASASTYKVATEKSKLMWHATKLGGAHNGTINLKSGAFEFTGDGLKNGKFEIDMASITNLDVKDPKYNLDLTNHLKSDDFFSAEKNPVGTFELTSATKKDEKNFDIEGKLTLKGIPQNVKIPSTIEKDGDGNLKIHGKAVLDRTLWGIKYRSAKFVPNVGDKLIHDNFDVELDLLAVADAGGDAKPMKKESPAKKKKGKK